MLDIISNLRSNQLDKILFLGTPEFAARHLEKLIDSSENIIGVVTQIDKPAGRGQRETSPPVKISALKAGLPVYQPENKLELEKLVLELAPDILIVVAFGMLITPTIVNNYLCLNVHGSLLPKYRGAAPVQYAVLNGDPESGVSIMVLDEKMDTGPVILYKSVRITPENTSGDLFAMLTAIGPVALEDALQLLRSERENIVINYQDDSKSSYTKKLSREDARLDLGVMTPAQIVRRVKAFNPWPGTFVMAGEHQVMIIDAGLDSAGNLSILEVQPESKKKMSYTDYLRGYPPII